MSARPNASRRSTAAAAATTKTSASIGSTSAPYYYYHQGGMAQTAQPYSYPYQYQTTATAEPYHPYSRAYYPGAVNVGYSGTRAMYDSPYYAQGTAATMAPYNNYNYGVGNTAFEFSSLNPISYGVSDGWSGVGRNMAASAGMGALVCAGLSGAASGLDYAGVGR